MYCRIIIVAILFSLKVSASTTLSCFEVKSEIYMIKKISEQKYSLTHKKSSEAIHYFCSNKDELINCSAEDDSGHFKIKDNRIQLGERQYFGTPDQQVHLLEYSMPDWISLTKCK
jgi:hypothetical protein